MQGHTANGQHPPSTTQPAPPPSGSSNGSGHTRSHGDVSAGVRGHGHGDQGSLVADMAAMPSPQLADMLWGWLLSRGYDPAVFGAVCEVVAARPQQ